MASTGNAKLDQKYQKQQDKLIAAQNQDRQKLEQKQDQEHQRLTNDKAAPERTTRNRHSKCNKDTRSRRKRCSRNSPLAVKLVVVAAGGAGSRSFIMDFLKSSGTRRLPLAR
jgi:hypothetical protein